MTIKHLKSNKKTGLKDKKNEERSFKIYNPELKKRQVVQPAV